jgi:hypothetical protein
VDKAKRDMEAFAAANESRLYKLLKTIVDPQSDLRALIKAKVGLCATQMYFESFADPLRMSF